MGVDIPKTLLTIAGRSLLNWQLDLLREREVVVVAGYKADRVIAEVASLRPDIPVVVNRRYAETGTAASLRLGAQLACDWIVTLDGDLLVTGGSLADLFQRAEPAVGILPRSSQKSVGVEIDPRGRVVGMGFDVSSDWEWSGLAIIKRDDVLRFGDGHVFESLLPLLPLQSVIVDAVELDDPADIARAETWLASHERHLHQETDRSQE